MSVCVCLRKNGKATVATIGREWNVSAGSTVCPSVACVGGWSEPWAAGRGACWRVDVASLVVEVPSCRGGDQARLGPSSFCRIAIRRPCCHQPGGCVAGSLAAAMLPSMDRGAVPWDALRREAASSLMVGLGSCSAVACRHAVHLLGVVHSIHH